MASSERPVVFPSFIDPAWRIGIVYSDYYKEEMDQLLQGASITLKDAGIRPENITLHRAPGSFEIPLIGATLVERRKVDAMIGLGIILEGKTHHARLLAEAVTRGIMDIQIRSGIPFAFEILYVDSLDLVRERCAPGQNKGTEGAVAVLHSLAELHALQS